MISIVLSKLTNTVRCTSVTFNLPSAVKFYVYFVGYYIRVRFISAQAVAVILITKNISIFVNIIPSIDRKRFELIPKSRHYGNTCVSLITWLIIHNMSCTNIMLLGLVTSN